MVAERRGTLTAGMKRERLPGSNPVSHIPVLHGPGRLGHDVIMRNRCAESIRGHRAAQGDSPRGPRVG